MNKHLWVINRYSAKNFGDRLIADCIETAIKGKGCLVTKKEYVGQKSNSKLIKIPLYLLKICKINSLVILIRVLLNYPSGKRKKPNAFVIGGGQLLLPNDSFPYAMLGWVLMAKFLKVPLYFFSVGIETAEGKLSFIKKNIIKYCLKSAEDVWLRDLHSRNIVVKLVKKKYPIVPDVVYVGNYKKQCNKKKNALLFISSFKETKTDLIDRPTTRCDYYDKIERVLENLDCSYRIILSNSSLGDIEEVNRFFDGLNQEKKKKIEKEIIYEKESFLSLLRKSTYVVSTRMHPVIFAHAMGINFKSIPLNRKTLEMESFLKNNSKEKMMKKIFLAIDELLAKINDF